MGSSVITAIILLTRWAAQLVLNVSETVNYIAEKTSHVEQEQGLATKV